MEIMQLSYWLYFAQFWVAIGLFLVILEVTDGSAIFFLPLGLAGLLLGLIIYLVEIALIPTTLVPDKWYWIVVYWVSLSVVIAFIISFLKHKRKQNGDINQY